MFSFWPFAQSQPVEDDSSLEEFDEEDRESEDYLENELGYLENDLEAFSSEQKAVFRGIQNSIYWLVSHAVVMLDFGPCEHIQLFNQKIEELRKKVYTVFQIDFVFPYPEGTSFSGFSLFSFFF